MRTIYMRAKPDTTTLRSPSIRNAKSRPLDITSPHLISIPIDGVLIIGSHGISTHAANSACAYKKAERIIRIESMILRIERIFEII